MEPSLTPILLVDHTFQALTPRFLVETTPQDFIYHLKTKVKERCHRNFSGYDHDIDISELKMWKPKGEMILNKFTPQIMAKVLARLNVDNEDTIEYLHEDEKVTDLGPLDSHTLLVQLPVPGPAGTSHISTIVGCILILRLVIALVIKDRPLGPLTTSNVDQEYAHCFLQADTEESFTEDDMRLNNINDTVSEAPKFVKDYEEILSRKRKVASNVRCFFLYPSPF
jgi:hypothetical protein